MLRIGNPKSQRTILVKYSIFSFLISFILIFVYLLYGYIFQTSEIPWSGYQYIKNLNGFEFSFGRPAFQSQDQCKRYMNWNVKFYYEEILEQKNKGKYFLPSEEAGPFRPVGCGFSSNNFFLTYFVNQIFAGYEVQLVCEHLNPNYDLLKERYMPAISLPAEQEADEFLCWSLL